ncbi:hypothetical protein OROGR_010162 [Orobanche gracilis]
MEYSDQRRKRKRILRQSYSSSSSYNSPRRLLSVRSLLVCFSFVAFVYLLSCRSPFTASVLRPVSVVSTLSLLSSSSSRTVKSVREFGAFYSSLKIENRVFFPDHVLLLVSCGKRCGVSERSKAAGEMECVYYGQMYNFRKYSGDFENKEVLSVDEYDGFRSIVRCPLPSVNYSNFVGLKLGKNWFLREKSEFLVNNQTVINSWENLAYETVLDGDTVVVFVKGLNLRRDRKSDPIPFSCHFGSGKWGQNGNESYTLSTKALTAAQEVVRCPLPASVSRNTDKSQGIRVTVGSTRGVHPRSHDRVLMPSVAEVLDLGADGRNRMGKRYELCVCTMVWNQASAIREWIMYHSWLGVEKWFVYDNNSDDVIENVIRELNVEDYNVVRRVWPWIKTQEAGFSHCALKSKDECNWVSFMDVDEYFYFPYSTPGHQLYRTLGHAPRNSLRALVANISSSSGNIGEIRTSCHSFGPSGLKSLPARGVTAGYTCRLQSPERHKSIVRPDAVDPTLLNVVHHFHLRRGFDYTNLPESTATINHYKYQVWEVFGAKFYRRVATYVADWQENQNEGSRDRAPGLGTEAVEPSDWPLKFCEVWDTGLRDFVLSNLADASTGLLPWEGRLV